MTAAAILNGPGVRTLLMERHNVTGPRYSSTQRRGSPTTASP
ncbi:hypothetical protein ABZ552_22135 [Nocardia sp. NPDC019219]